MDEALTLLNFVICCAGVYMCACRIAHMPEGKTKTIFAIPYMIWLPTFVAAGLYGNPTVGQVILGAAILVQMGIGVNVWRFGPPYYARIDNDFIRKRFETGD